ncbi:hypothetical protein [Tsuneonella sp. HG222]
MELAAVIISAILGWQHAVLGKREVQAMALVVLGWTAVVTAATITDLSLERTAVSLLLHAALVAVPYVAAMAIKRLVRR